MNSFHQTGIVYDAIVIGSGITGGWAAKELTEKGLNTIVLEAGRPIVPEKDYVEHVPAWQLPYKGLNNRLALRRDQPIQSLCAACDEWASKFFVSDTDNPYSTDPEKPFHWIRGRQVGGKSITWGRQTYRWSDLDFEANVRDGVAIDWPIRYQELAPWYSYVESFAGISGQAEGLAHLPDSIFQPAMEFNCAEIAVRDAIAKSYAGERLLTMGRCAILTRPHGGRYACHSCGPCNRGCVTRSYFSSLNSTLPAAMKTGRLTVRPHSVVHSLIFDANTRRVTGVRVIDGQTKVSLEFKARILFLCASTLESTRILMNSATPEFSTGLANSSGELGHNLMDHMMSAGATGIMPGMNELDQVGNRPTNSYIPRFRNVKTKSPSFLRGYGYQCDARRAGWERGLNMRGFGADFKQTLRHPGSWRMNLHGFGECLPRHENFVALDPTKLDAWGIPTLRIHCSWGENELVMKKDVMTQAAEILAAAGAVDVEAYDDNLMPGLTIHEMGTARMGNNAKASVLNSHNQAHDIANLFLTDGACMTSSACVNPSLTYMALTARACDFAVSEMRKGNL